MKKIIILLFIICSFLFSKEFKIASYNVENFFDLNYDVTEYKEFIPNRSHWNKKAYKTKLNNVLKVLNDLNADIIALQEIESKKVINDLIKKLPEYKYYKFIKYDNSSVGVAILSKIKIINNKQIDVKFQDKIFRPILETTFILDDIKFKIFNNHWPSKRSKEKYRVKYAYELLNRIKQLPSTMDYIILGDLNSNYNENETLYSNKKLNDTLYITGINNVLNTTIDNNFVSKGTIKNKQYSHYNLWLELPYKNRYSYIFKSNNSTPDNMILPASLFDDENIFYKYNSFNVFKPDYLIKNRKINRWNMRKQDGFSDHLPIYATFSTKKLINQEIKRLSTIQDIYDITQINEPFSLKDAVVIYKSNNSAIVKQKNSRAIFIYNAQDLKLNNSYDLKIFSIKDFYGLKEIDKFKIIKKNKKPKNMDNFYIDKFNDFSDLNLQNEVIKNLVFTYKDKFLYYENSKIRVYFKDKNLIPKVETKLLIKKAQIGYFKKSPQIVIYNKNDFKYLK
ncbi:endonuclease [Malaciobacter molluscorum LMG 25693]|uniref:Endonuclease n=1 Tax=Malaciobacter molluscorum LMG 25693 TaxID=870501 RepID=A0A2G1DER5_9BACT|nr:endonuclease/exonuclease/phosphatase family protein [Malaciobacter molluscorum]AXX92806.1 endonuclease/exonuclease/phosphatase [Malaciobacter molluscorum LMG 25693]PHO17002.1 endonuclease [Malaciobacter molluscorum LMG 25693]